MNLPFDTNCVRVPKQSLGAVICSENSVDLAHSHDHDSTAKGYKAKSVNEDKWGKVWKKPGTSV